MFQHASEFLRRIAGTNNHYFPVVEAARPVNTHYFNKTKTPNDGEDKSRNVRYHQHLSRQLERLVEIFENNDVRKG